MNLTPVEDMIHYTTKLFRFQANQIVNQISDSPQKQEQKRDMKRIKQNGISILELCLPPPKNMKFQIWFSIWLA